MAIQSQIWNTNDELQRQLTQNFNNLSLSVETKVNGTYSSLESPSGVKIFPEASGGKSALCRFYELTPLRNAAGTDTIAHGIVNFTKIIRIWGVANKISSVLALPLPYATATAADVIELNIDVTNINIVVGKDMSDYGAYVYVEYLLD